MLVKGFIRSKSNCQQNQQLRSEVFKSRVELASTKKNNSNVDTFKLAICGIICSPSGSKQVIAKISITDITDGTHKAKPVHTSIENCQLKNSNIFCYNTEMGKLPCSVTILSDWMAVTDIPVDWLIFPYKGKRNLQFKISVLSDHNDDELARTTCTFFYENSELGYIELEKNMQYAKTMAVPLAFTIAAADKRISGPELKVIENWVKNDPTTSKTSRKFNTLLARIIASIPIYNRIYSHKICKKIAKTAPLKVRCDILDLCLNTIVANGTAAAKQMDLLKNIAEWIGIYLERFRDMMEKTLPVSMLATEDIEICLGVTSNMNKTQTCRQLSKEYRKWNARVTNRNSEIKTQAENMLKLIAEIRNQCLEQERS